MALLLPEDWGFNGAGDLAVLARGVRDASGADESDWIEWKSTLDLKSKADCFVVARTILGMANRDPNTLRRSGHGYLLVGVEPGSLQGVTPADLADLRPRVGAYTGGSDGPNWHPSYIALDGADILVVVIDPPRMGDRIWVLRRESPPMGAKHRTVPDGTVFFRDHGATQRASAATMDMLHNRSIGANHVPNDLKVSVEGHIPYLDVSTVSEAVDAWVEKKRTERLRSTTRKEPVRHAPKSGSSAAEMMLPTVRALAESATTVDYRSRAEYAAEVDAWAAELKDWAIETIYRMSAGEGQVVHLTNQGNRYLPGIEFELEVGGLSGRAWDGDLEIEHPPEPPKPFGSLLPSPVTRFPALDLADYRIQPSPSMNTWVEEDPLRILDSGEDLAATRGYSTDRVYLLLLDEPPGNPIKATWTASCQGMDGILDGAVELESSDVQYDFGGLLDDVFARCI